MLMKNFINKNNKIKKTVLEVGEVAEYLWQKGWAEAGAGNISVNISQLVNTEPDFEGCPVLELEDSYPNLSNQYFYFTGMGKRMRDIAGNPLNNTLIIKLNQKGDTYCVITKNNRKEPDVVPTSELPTHLSIHQQLIEQGKNEKVIIHTHVTELIAFSHSPEIKSKTDLNKLIWSMHPETMTFIPDGIGFVPFALPGTVDIAKKTLEEFKSHNVVLWEKHGVFAIGENVEEAFDKVDMISKSVKIWFMCKQAGFEPNGLSREQIDQLKKYYSTENNI